MRDNEPVVEDGLLEDEDIEDKDTNYANWASTLNAQQMELGIWRFLTTGDP